MIVQEQRRHVRNSATMDAFVTFDGDRKRVLPCVVVDYSDSGARLQCEAAKDLPDRLVLTIPGASRIRQAEVRWRMSDVIGVEFVDEKNEAIGS